jgi:hypothetical protein
MVTALSLAVSTPARASFPVAQPPTGSPFESNCGISEHGLESLAGGPRNQSGPRVGITMLDDSDRPFLSQFGWSFERQVTPFTAGPQFVLEATPMVGGIEAGELAPSLTIAVGTRFPGGVEFAAGPSFSTHPGSALVGLVGRSIDLGRVSLPVTLSFSTGTSGPVSFALGYAIHH